MPASRSGEQPGPNTPPFKRENRAAVAGVIASNIGFVVPFVGGLVGIAFGIIGLRKTRDPNVGGRGLAIAAIVVGILSIATSIAIFWSLNARIRLLNSP
jgi:Kef-type K+ transport system membrane component KefB